MGILDGWRSQIEQNLDGSWTVKLFDGEAPHATSSFNLPRVYRRADVSPSRYHLCRNPRDHKERHVEHFNKLTPAEAERLAYLAEELGETIQAIGKILRHGYASYDPTKMIGGKPGQGVGYTPPRPSSNNREDLERELADVFRAVDRLTDAGDLSSVHIHGRRMEPKRNAYMHHQPEWEKAEV